MTQAAATEPDAVELLPADVRLRRAHGLRLLGRYEGSGYVEDRFLACRPDGQRVLLTPLLQLVLRLADGDRDVEELCAAVSAEHGSTLTPPALALLVHRRLVPAGLVEPIEAGAGSRPVVAPRADPLLSVVLRRQLLSTSAVRRLCPVLATLFGPGVVALVLAGFVVSDWWLLVGGASAGPGAAVVSRPGEILWVLGLLLASTIFHELGHAAGCSYGGGRPGGVGAGVYLWMPVFWTDVTDAYRLDQAGRLRTDLGGIYFNAVFLVELTAVYRVTGWAPAAVAALLTNLVILQQLLPFVRMDGYYILGDLVGVPNLFGLVGPMLRSLRPGRRAGAGEQGRSGRSGRPGRSADLPLAALRPRARLVATGWVALTVPGLVGSLGWLLWQSPALVTGTWSQARALWVAGSGGADLVTAVLAWVLLVLLLLPVVGLGMLALKAARLGWSRAAGAVRRSARPQDPGSSPEVAMPSSPAADDADPLRVVPPLPTLSAADFTEETMLRRRRRAPARGWRRGVFLASAGMVNPAPSAAQRRQEALVARVCAPLAEPRRVVVLSRKGGAGKTTTTVMLGHTFATHRGDRVVALDANPDAGSLPYRVPRGTDATVTTLLADAARLGRYADLRGYTSQARTRLEVVASDDDPRISQAIGQADYHRAVEVLDRYYTLLLLDTGTGILDDAVQGLLREADQVVVVMPPALDGARVAASTLDWLEQHGHERLVRGAVAVINAVRGEGGLVLLDQIEDHFAARCSGVVRVPWDRALEAGACVDLDDLHPATREAYLELAAIVADGFARPGGRS